MDTNKKNNKNIINVLAIVFIILIIAFILVWYFFIKKDDVLEKNIELSENEVVLMVGDTVKINVDFIPDDTTNKNLIWYSNDKSVAVVDDGSIKSIGPGVTMVNVQTVNGIDKSILVVCTNSEELKFNTDVIEMNVGETIDTGISKVEEVNFIFTEKEIVNVDSSGKVYALSQGVVNVIAHDENGNYAMLKVIVK